MKRLVGLFVFVIFLAVSLGGCACGPKKVESEPAPPVQTMERAPAPQPLPPAKPAPVKKGRN